MLCFPNAKINIGLNVITRRSDGYHNIETVFCPVDLTDILEIVPQTGMPAGSIQYTATGIPVEGPEENNLCIKAYHLLNKDISLPAICIHLHKIIPPGAGLGGGSSNAASMLKSLNSFLDIKLTDDQLCTYASRLGSDCAFFIKNRILFGYERGNCFREIPELREYPTVVIINPGIHVSTPLAYSGIKPSKPLHPLEDLFGLPLHEWKDNIMNDFERYIVKLHPVIGEIKKKLYELGAVYASMSGSGSSVYGLFRNKVPTMQDHFSGFFCWSGSIIH